MDTVKCEQCGSQIPRTTRFCPDCGHINPSAPATAAGTSPIGGAPTINITNTPAPVPMQQSQPTQYMPPSQTSYAQPPAPGYMQTQSLTPQAPIQPYSNNPQNALGYQYQQQIGVAGVPTRDSTIALLLELLGYFGFLGIGHIYANRVTRGIALMVGWWLYGGLVAALFITILLSPVACLMLIAWPIVPILSGLWIKSDLDKENAFGRSRY